MSAVINFIIFCFCFHLADAYNPTVIIHGIMFNVTDRMEFLKEEIERSQGNTVVEIIEILWGTQSFYPMWAQVAQFQRPFVEFMNSNRGPVNLIAYSQGGLIARGVLQATPNHTVSRFISLSSPQNGFHGEFYVPRTSFSVGNEEKYSKFGQKGSRNQLLFGKQGDSVAGFWKDPRDMIRYKREGRFLATANNEFRHELNDQFRTSMCKLDQLVLIGGPDDGVVVPWQSAHFGFDDKMGNIINMEQQPIYTNDCICLQALDRKGAITKYTVPGVRHPDWHNNATVIRNYILPHLL